MSSFRHLYICTHLRWKRLFSNGIHFRVANACDADEYNGRSKIILAALFCRLADFVGRVSPVEKKVYVVSP